MQPRATVVAVVLLAAGLLAGCADTSDDREPTSPTSSTPATSTSTSTSTSTAPAAPAVSAGETVLAWLDAVGEGEIETAVDLTGLASTAYLEAAADGVENYVRVASEGYGAWSASTDRTTTEYDVGASNGFIRSVVVVSGTWRGEGTTEQRNDALPVVRMDGGPWLVEPVAIDPDTRGGAIELVAPERQPGAVGAGGLPPEGLIEVTAAGDGDFWFALDNARPSRVEGERRGDATHARWDPSGRMANGTHLLVVAYVDGDTFTALATTFTVEG